MLVPGQILGRYRLGEPLGTGGMGTVFAATHLTLGTEHALKILRVDDPEGRRRLLAEGRTQARLSHPNVVPVRDALELPDGRPVLVFDRVRGPSLAVLLEHASLEPDEAVRLWRGVVDGVAHAHAHDIVHRDLKPANILLDTEREPSCPRVTDFGIARCLSVPGATAPGQALGSVGHLAPEQLLDAASAGPQADVFSLGVLLLELLTGEPPFEGARGAAWLQAVEEADGTVPEGVPEELVSVVRRCLRSRPEDRFADARALSAALERGPLPETRPTAPPSTRPSPVPASRWVGVGVLVASVGVLLGLGATLLLRPPPVPPSSTSVATQVIGDLEREAWSRSADEPAAALALLRAAGALRGEAVPDNLVLDLVGRGAAQHVLEVPDTVPVVAVDDSTVAAIATSGEVRLWDRHTGEVQAAFSTGVFQPRQLDLWPGAAGIVTRNHERLGTSRTEAVAWDRQGHATIYAPGAGRRVLVDGLVIAEVGEDVVAWDLDGEERWRRPHPGSVVRLLVDEGVVHLVGRDRTVSLRTATGEVLPELGVGDELLGIVPGEGSVLLAEPDALRWRTAEGGLLSEVRPRPEVGELAWSAASEALAVWSPRGSTVWLLRDGQGVRLEAHDRKGVQAAFLDDGHLVTSSWDGQVRLWGEHGQLLHTLGRHTGLITSMAVEGDTVVTGSLDRTVRLWSRPDRLLGALRTRQGPELRSDPHEVEASPRGVLVGSADGRVTGWEPATDRRVRLRLPRAASAVAASGETILAVDSQGQAVVRVGDGAVVPFETTPHAARAAVSPDGTHVAVASRRRVELRTVDGRAIGGGPLAGYQVALAFSDDGQTLLVGHGEQGDVDVWSVRAGSPTRTLHSGLSQVRGISRLEVAGERVIAGFYGGGVAVWDGEGRRLWQEDVGADVVLLVARGEQLLLGDRDGGLQLRAVSDGRLLAESAMDEMATAALFEDARGALIGDARGRLIHWGFDGPPRARRAHRGPIATVFVDRLDARGPGTGEEVVWTVGLDGLARAWRRQSLAAPIGGRPITGRLTNLRVCASTHEVVAVVPFPSPDSVWAPAEACEH